VDDRPPVWADLTVVIPTIGRPLIARCLRSIVDGEMWPAEIVVVDQGSDRTTSDAVARAAAGGLRVTLVRSEQRGIAAGTNRGIERVGTRYVATTHDDCRVRADWVSTLARALPGLGDAILTGRVEPEGEGLVLTVIVDDERHVYTRPQRDRDVLFPPNMAFPVGVVERVGPFDEHPSLSLAGEDNEWAYRALRAGIPIVYEPSVVVRHVGWQDERRRTEMYRRYARGQGAFYGKYVRTGDVFVLRRAAVDAIRAPWWIVRGMFTRNRDLLCMGAGCALGLPAGLVRGFTNDGRFVRAFPDRRATGGDYDAA
jgi:GT2 family glycosyltransferase